jgi:spectinomycin phosphotransferase
LTDVGEDGIRAAVQDGWDVRIDDLRYLPVGAGAYHWTAGTGDGRRWLVTVDDLDGKPWLGSRRDEVFAGLQTAYTAAIELRAAGAAFVAAPIPRASGRPSVRLDDRYCVSVFEYVDGEPGRWGEPFTDATARQLVTTLARLHRSEVAAPIARRPFRIPGRADFDDALAELDQRWDAGPLAEPARQLLATHADAIVASLADLDAAAVELASASTAVVVTHGEPHPANVIRTDGGPVLVDWDTVALDRPERDLWMLTASDPALARRYRDLTGIRLDPDVMATYGRLWGLTDIAAYTDQLRRPHRDDADAERALHAIRTITSGQEPAPYGTPPPPGRFGPAADR